MSWLKNPFRKDGATEQLKKILKGVLTSQGVEETAQIKGLISLIASQISEEQSRGIIQTLSANRADIHTIIDQMIDECDLWINENQAEQLA